MSRARLPGDEVVESALIRIAVVIAIAIAVVSAACSSSPHGAPPAATPATTAAVASAAAAPGSGDARAAAPDAAPPPGARGDGCTPGDDAPAGTCGPGLLCMAQAPGGYCLSFCGPTGTACDDGACMDTARAGQICARRCAGDGDCRTAEGYVCDPAWHACMLPGIGAPRPPTCPAGPALAAAPFGAATQLTGDASPGVYQLEPATALDAAGDVVALHMGLAAQGVPNTLGVARVPARGGAATDAALALDRDQAFDPWLARDAAGTLHAVWLGFDGAGAPERRMEIAYATSTDGGATWSRPRAIHDPHDCPDAMPGCLDKPMIAIGPGPGGKGERIYVAYASEAQEGLRVIASADGGKTFGASVAATPGIYGDLAIAPDGALHVVAADASPRAAFGSPTQSIDHVVSTDGGATFGAAVHVSGDGESIPFFFVSPRVAVDARRKTIYAAYARGGADLAWDVVLAASQDGGATWTRTVVNDEHCAARMVPSLAVDPASGRVHLTWLDDRDGVGFVAYAACAPGGARCGANQRIAAPPFGAWSVVRHGAAWVGEYAGLVVDGKRRRLHAVWTQPVATPKGAIARVFHAEAKL